MKVSPRTIGRAVHTDLQLGSYVRTPKHLLTDEMKARRHERIKKSVALPEAAWTNRKNIF
jgi:hypothetical protein